MKQIKDSMKKMDEKYVKVEGLTEIEKESTYGGAFAIDGGLGGITLKYGVPTIKPTIRPTIKPTPKLTLKPKTPIPTYTTKYGVPVIKYGTPVIK